MNLFVKPLTEADFAPFGSIVAPKGSGGSANAGMARKFDEIVNLTNDRATARPNLALFDVQPYALPLTMRQLEQHPHSTQTFLPLAVARYAIAVTLPAQDGSPDLSSLHAFLVGPDTGVSYHAGTWHHAIMALERPGRFASLTWEDGTPGDCVFHDLDRPLTLSDQV